MKAQLNIGNIQSLSNINTGEVKDFQKGQTFWGRIVSIDGNSVDIRAMGGVDIHGLIEGNISFSSNTSVRFMVVESSQDMLILKPILESNQGTALDDRYIAGIIDSLGLENSVENTNFIKNQDFLFGRNMGKVIALLDQYAGEDGREILKNVLVKPQELLEYIKGFEDEGKAKFLRGLGSIFQQLKEAAHFNFQDGPVSNMLKGLSIQINNGFPLFFIPVPMNYNGDISYGEIWIEKDAENDTKNEGTVSLYIFSDTPHLGRVEVDIKYSGKDMGIQMYCRKDVVAMMDKYKSMLKQSVASLGLNVMNIGVSELKIPRSFMDFSKKYIKPYFQLDVRI